MRHILVWITGVCIGTASTALLAQQPPAPPTSTVPLSKQVDEAIKKGKDALLALQQADGSWPAYVHDPSNPKDWTFSVGTTAMAVYALLESGMSPQDPKMEKALQWLTKQKTERTYELAFRCSAYEAANRGTDDKYKRNLQADADYLVRISKDGSYNYFPPKESSGNTIPKENKNAKGEPMMLKGDNSNSQYGAYGPWTAARGGCEIPGEYWAKILKYWMECQGADGGWGYDMGSTIGESTPAMTCAGLASLFVCNDYLLAAGYSSCKGGDFGPLARGLDYLSKNLEAAVGGGNDSWGNAVNLYLLYGVERVSLACGYKYFGKIDWYKLAADKVIAGQDPTDNTWQYFKDKTVGTSYAMLFLCRGRNAVMFNKLQFTSADPTGKVPVSITDWNCRPRDLAWLCSWMSTDLERTVNWQIINLDVDVKEWHDAPILYIAGSLEPKFSDNDIQKLRTFVLQGGTIVSCAECDGAGFKKGIRAVYAKVFPEYKMQDVPANHDLYSKKLCKVDLNGKPKFQMIFNGVRPLVLHTDEDLSKAWQLNKKGSELTKFQAMFGVSMYVTDLGGLGSSETGLRARGSQTWPDEVTAAPKGTINVVRLQWDGKWNPEPLALERFSRLCQAQMGYKINVVTPVAVKDIAKANAKVAIISGVGKWKMDSADAAALVAFVHGGGTLLVDAAGGNEEFYNSARDNVENAFTADGALRGLAATHAMYNMDGVDDGLISTVKYRRKTRERIGRGVREPLIKAIFVTTAGNERPGVLFSREDITCAGLVGYQSYGVDGYDPGTADLDGTAYRLMRNIVFYGEKLGATSQPATTPTATTKP